MSCSIPMNLRPHTSCLVQVVINVPRRSWSQVSTSQTQAPTAATPTMREAPVLQRCSWTSVVSVKDVLCPCQCFCPILNVTKSDTDCIKTTIYMHVGGIKNQTPSQPTAPLTTLEWVNKCLIPCWRRPLSHNPSTKCRFERWQYINVIPQAVISLTWPFL